MQRVSLSCFTPHKLPDACAIGVLLYLAVAQTSPSMLHGVVRCAQLGSTSADGEVLRFVARLNEPTHPAQVGYYTMSKQRLLLFASWLLALVAVAGVLPTMHPGVSSACAPASFTAAIKRAVALGITVVPNNDYGHISGSVVLAAVPTTYTDAALLPVGDFKSPRWIGRVLVVGDPLVCVDLYPAQYWRRWGSCVAFGDPDLLNEMTSEQATP